MAAAPLLVIVTGRIIACMPQSTRPKGRVVGVTATVDAYTPVPLRVVAAGSGAQSAVAATVIVAVSEYATAAAGVNATFARYDPPPPSTCPCGLATKAPLEDVNDTVAGAFPELLTVIWDVALDATATSPNIIALDDRLRIAPRAVSCNATT